MSQIRLLALISGLVWLSAAWPQGASPEPEPPSVGWDRSPGAVVFELRSEIGMIAEAERGPVTTVYGDGTVEVAYPPYMKRAGRWRARIGAGELASLVDRAVNARLFELEDADLARLVRRAAGEKAAAGGELSVRSDAEWTVLRLRLTMSAGKKDTALHNVIRVRDLPWNASRFPELTELSELADFVERIRALARAPGLERVTP